MNKIVYYLVLALFCFGCNIKTTNSDENIEFNDCMALDENKIFNDKKWFLPYADADNLDSLRATFEQWKYRLDDECEITLTLYEDSTFVESSPCEWNIVFSGYYQYVCDTLFCVRIDIDDHSINAYDLPRVKYLEKYIKQGDSLKFIWRKEQITSDKFEITDAPSELIFYIVKT